jgi:UDP-sulfoquinovose synthase
VLNEQFLALGLNPTTLSNGLLEEVTEVANKYKHRVDPTKIIARSVWREGMATSRTSSPRSPGQVTLIQRQGAQG